MSFVSQAVVTAVIKHKGYLREYVLSIEKERKYNPGSFVQLTLDSVTASDIWPDSRTFSIASYEMGSMRFIIKRAGYYTTRIFDELQIGSRCTVKYPFGDLFNRSTLDEKHLFLAGGVGITPFLGLSKYFENNGLAGGVRLFYSARYHDDLLHHDVLKRAFGDRLELFITRENIVGCHNRRICMEDIVRVADVSTNVYICGSKEFNADYSKQLFLNGYGNIHMDEWE